MFYFWNIFGDRNLFWGYLTHFFVFLIYLTIEDIFMVFSDILPEEIEQQLKEFAEVSMGTAIGEDDMENIVQLADQVIEITDYRAQLFEYLKVSSMFMVFDLPYPSKLNNSLYLKLNFRIVWLPLLQIWLF